VEALADQPFVMPSRVAAEGLRRDIEEACAGAGFRPRISRETRSLSAVLLLVAAGAGVALIPASVAHLYPVPGVHYARLAEPSPVTTAGMAWRPGGNSRVVEEFMEITRDVARSHEGDEDVWPERHIVSE
jgi:LysR family transcriptional activator of glutamate synthase operon